MGDRLKRISEVEKNNFFKIRRKKQYSSEICMLQKMYTLTN